MSTPDTEQHKFNPVTPDVSPPPPGMTSQFTTPRTQQFNLPDSTPLGDVSKVTSVDINEMENVRNHLQNMLKTFKGFNIDEDYEPSRGTAEQEVQGEGDGNHSMSTVDTAAFLQKLLPNSSPLEEIKVHFGDHSRGTQAADETLRQTPHSSTQDTQSTYKSGANKSLMAENTLLREHLDRERFRRKHCEQQIQELHTKLLEIQQELAVAKSSERKKDVMIEQLDKTLAKVVEGWKRHEQEKLIVINTLKQERDVQEQSHKKQQEILLQFEKELSQAVEALTKEQNRATEAEREKQLVIEKQKGEREQLLQILSKEKEKIKHTDEEKMNVIKEKEQAQQKYIETERKLSELSDKNSKLQLEFTNLEEKFSSSLNEEKKRLQEERKVVKDSKDAMSTLKKEIQRLEMEHDTVVREKESLKMEMSLMQARYEASRAKEETERQAELERQVTQKLEDLQERMSKSEKELRETHRQQIQVTNNKHKEEMRQQMEKFHEEIKKKDIKFKTAATEYEERLTDAQDKIATLSNQRQHLENQRQNLTIRMHQMMQAHCDEALRLLSANKSPGNMDNKMESVFKPSTSEANPKWLYQTSSPPSMFKNLSNKYPAIDGSSSYQYYATNPNTNPQTSIDFTTRQREPMTSQLQYSTQNEPVTLRQPNNNNNFHSSQKTPVIFNQQHTQPIQPIQHSDPKQYSPTMTSLTVPSYPGYQVNKGSYQESGTFFGSYLGDGLEVDGESEVTRSGVDFVPLKVVQDDTHNDANSVISGLHESPGSGHSNGGGGSFPDMDYQYKVTSSGGSHGILLEQELDESRMTVTSVSPEILQKTSNRNEISEKLEEQEQRQAELNHYVNMLLKRSPGHPQDEILEHLSSGLMAIPSSVQGHTQDDFPPFKTKHPGYRYSGQSQDIMAGSDSVTKDPSQQSWNSAPAFTKSTVPTTFSIKQLQSQGHHQVPQYTHPAPHPQTPPRRDKDPINQDTSKQPPLSPRQVKQLSKLLSLMAEGQPGVQVPSTEQLFGVLQEMQKKTPNATQFSMEKDIIKANDTSKQVNGSAKRNLDTSYQSTRKLKSHPNQPPPHTNPTKPNIGQRKRPPSVDGGQPHRLGADGSVPRHQAPTKASNRQSVQLKLDKRTAPPPLGGKQTKLLTAWR